MRWGVSKSSLIRNTCSGLRPSSGQSKPLDAFAMSNKILTFMDDKLMIKFKLVLTIGLVAMLASAATATTVSYRMMVDGNLLNETGLNPITVGEHTLAIQANVTDNALPGDNNGGLLLGAFNLDTEGGELEFEEAVGPFGPLGEWASSFNTSFNSNFAGKLNQNDFAVFSHTAGIAPGDYTARFNAVSANQWQTITEGAFNYNGGVITLNLLASTAETLVAGIDGSTVIGTFADTVNATSAVLGIPEPASIGLISMGLFGLATARRRAAR